MKTETEITGLEGVLESLRALPAEMTKKRGGPVRAAVRKAAQLLRKEARAQMIARGNNPGKTGINYATGFTAKHIIIKRRKINEAMKGERFIVTVKPVPHPNGNKIGKRPIKTNDVAFIMEHGSANQPAEPWLRPAYNARKEEAVRVMVDTLQSGIDKIVAELARKNAGK